MARSVTDKTSHLGRAGQFAAMAEILARGWNVAIPEVDTGDDVFVAQDDGARLTRVQLKTTIAEERGAVWTTKTITLPLQQLMRDDEEVPLTYALVIRVETRWEFIVIARDELREIWKEFQERLVREREAGTKPKARQSKDQKAPAVAGIRFAIASSDVTAWGGRSFQACRNNWDAFELIMLPPKIAKAPGRSLNSEPPMTDDSADAPDSVLSGGE